MNEPSACDLAQDIESLFDLWQQDPARYKEAFLAELMRMINWIISGRVPRDRDDITQDVLIRVWQRIATYNPRLSQFSTRLRLNTNAALYDYLKILYRRWVMFVPADDDLKIRRVRRLSIRTATARRIVNSWLVNGCTISLVIMWSWLGRWYLLPSLGSVDLCVQSQL